MRALAATVILFEQRGDANIAQGSGSPIIQGDSPKPREPSSDPAARGHLLPQEREKGHPPRRALFSTSALAGGAMTGFVLATGLMFVPTPAQALICVSTNPAASGATDNTFTGATACGQLANANGGAATATGANSNANGANATATGVNSIAHGALATATGRDSNATGDNATATGALSNATGDNATATGQKANAIGDSATATGQQANAIGDFATATGQQSNAIGLAATATGAASNANGAFATATGASSNANGAAATATGEGSLADGDFATATGRGSNATGQFATATGQGSVANGDTASAFGQGAVATAVGTTAIGQGAKATADNSTAIGIGAQATGVSSSAIGAGAFTSVANEMAFGNDATTYRAAGITSAASLAAQTGPTKFVTSDAGGHLATSPFGPADIAGLAGGIANLSAYTNAGFANLQNQINDNARKATAGVASVSALAGLHHIDLPGRVSFVGGVGGFRNAVAVAAGASYLAETGNVRLSTGVSFSPTKPSVSWNVGGAFVW